MIGSEEKAAVMRVMDSGILSGFQGNWSDAFYGGPEVQALEKEWASYFGVRHAIAVNSATSGLWAACNAIGIKSGDEILVAPWSMTCSASIPLHFGAKPIFVDIEPDYFCMNPVEIENKITDKTRAIIAVSLFGQPCDFDAINSIAKKYGLIVIEDAAQSIGAKYKGKYSGSLTDIGVFSLNRHKHINCGEGGMITTNSDELAFALKLSINHAEAVCNDIVMQGKLSQFNSSIISLVGMNMRMTELSAAIAREQLKKLEGIIKVQQNYASYFPVKTRPGSWPSFYRYAVVDDKWKMHVPANQAEKLFNIKRHYITPIYRMPLFRHLGYPDGLCPTCEDVEENIVLAWLKP